MKKRLSPLTDPEDVPEFESEAQAREFWATHEITEAYLQKASVSESELPPVRQTTQSTRISLRIEDDTLKRLKRLAGRRRLGYQTLLKNFLIERLYEEEKRERR